MIFPSSNVQKPDRHFLEIKRLHNLIEDELQKHSPIQCHTCTSVCCKEDICRENIESPFLLFLSDHNNGNYSKVNGWFSKDSGCKIKHGRPLICYEFFCNRLSSDKCYSNLQNYSSSLKKIYVNVPQGQNLLVMYNPFDLSVSRKEAIIEKLSKLLEIILGEQILKE